MGGGRTNRGSPRVERFYIRKASKGHIGERCVRIRGAWIKEDDREDRLDVCGKESESACADRVVAEMKKEWICKTTIPFS